MKRTAVIAAILIICLYSSSFAGEVKLGLSFSIHKGLSEPAVWFYVDSEFNDNPRHKFKMFEWHHIYGGIIVYGIGSYLDYRPLKIVGGILVADDAIQHIFQVQTPFHLLNDGLWEFSAYRDMCRFLDGK